MGTKLGNLHIRNATVEEVAPLLPGAIVGQWAEGFVSAYSEEYQWGSVEQAGKKLSRKLPAATVLTAALFDSDVVSFEVYEAGKRLTAHLLNPYEDINRAGNPKVFCEALGLPPEDEKRLRTLWKKGDAEEQLELTGALLGLPLYHDPAYMPNEPTHRDVAAVDTWIAERPDPPKMKSVTKAELVQEISDVEPATFYRRANQRKMEDRFVVFTPSTDIDAHQIWTSTPNGTLRCTAEMTIVNRGGIQTQFACSQNRALLLITKFSFTPIPNWPGAQNGKPNGTYIVYDSSNKFSLPFYLSDGWLNGCIPTEDGGVWLAVSEEEAPDKLLRYGPDGNCVLEKTLGLDERVLNMTEKYVYTRQYNISGGETFFCYDLNGDLQGSISLSLNCSFLQVDSSGELWLGENLGRTIVHLDKNLNLLSRSSSLTSEYDYHVLDMDLSKDGGTVFLTSFQKGIFVLDVKDLSILRAKMTKDTVYDATVDGQGRFWAGVSDSVLEAYDRNLQTISRHRLKGTIINLYRNAQGDLIAYTHDHKRNIFRIYRIA